MVDEHFAVNPQGAFGSGYRQRVWDLVRAYGPDVTELCRAGSALMAGSGGIGLSAGPTGPQWLTGSARRVRFTADRASSRLEALQYTLDEGPSRDAAATGRPVQAADLSRGLWARRWPRFTAGALQAAVQAVLAVPLHAGAIRHDGAIVLCRQEPGGWDRIEQTAVIIFAAAVVELLTLERLGVDWTDTFTAARLDASILDIAGGVPVRVLPGLPATWDRPIARWFDRVSLSMVRRQVGIAGVGYGLRSENVYPLVLAVHEAMVNVVRHGGGRGQLLLWRGAGRMWCEISDHGPGIDAAHLDTGEPSPAIDSGTRRLGRGGLWLIHQGCIGVDITTDHTGTRLLLSQLIERT